MTRTFQKRFAVTDSDGNVQSRFDTREEADEAARTKAECDTWYDFFVCELKPLRVVCARTRIDIEQKDLVDE